MNVHRELEPQCGADCACGVGGSHQAGTPEAEWIALDAGAAIDRTVAATFERHPPAAVASPIVVLLPSTSELMRAVVAVVVVVFEAI